MQLGRAQRRRRLLRALAGPAALMGACCCRRRAAGPGAQGPPLRCPSAPQWQEDGSALQLSPTSGELRRRWP
eukprot:5306561-Lingulodinium_polyedra.AAC.1